jgi:prophage antirepressor-like protein
MELIKKSFNGVVIQMYGTVDEPLFKARDIADYLEIKNIHTSLKNIDDDLKVIHNMDTLGGTQKMLFLKEQAVYYLAMISRKDKAKDFRRWVLEVIKEIRMTGKYEMQQKSEKYEMLDYLKFLNQNKNAQSRIDLFIQDAIMNKINSQKLITNGNGNGNGNDKDNEEWSISRRLQEYYKITNKKQLNRGIEMGKIMKQEYIKRYNKPPEKREQYVDGTVRMVNHYTLKNWKDFGDEIIQKYFFKTQEI